MGDISAIATEPTQTGEADPDKMIAGAIAEIKSWEGKAKECEALGKHKQVRWFPYTISSNSRYSDSVKGVCEYCHDFLNRSLNDKERRGIEEFYKMLNEPFTI